MLDDLINKYQNIHANLNNIFENVCETHIIPNAEVEGAPKTVDEALYGMASMIFALEQIISDLNILRMEQNIEANATENN